MEKEDVRIPIMFYTEWYKKDVSPNLTEQQKEKLLKKISDYSLENVITTAGIKIPSEEFPELKPFSHTSKFSGMQIYTVMSEMFNELYGHKTKSLYPKMTTKHTKISIPILHKIPATSAPKNNIHIIEKEIATTKEPILKKHNIQLEPKRLRA